jgi:hypothetical protein
MSSLAFSSCSSLAKTIVLSGALSEKQYQDEAGLDATNAFDLEFKNFTLSDGGIRICPAY